MCSDAILVEDVLLQRDTLVLIGMQEFPDNRGVYFLGKKY
jgi:hypothetical protein